MTRMTTAVRKAAILVRSLDGRTADSLLGQLPADQAARVLETARQLGDIDPVEQQQVLDEFLARGARRNVAALDDAERGVEYVGNLSADGDSPPARPPLSLAEQSPRPSSSFQLLHQSAADDLARLLATEHPQTIALVLAHLSSDHAADVLHCLKPSVQVEVLRRLLDLDEANPAALEAVKRGLESRLTQHLRGKQRRTAGLATVRQILRAAGPIAERQLQQTIAVNDPELARLLGAPPRQETAEEPDSRHEFERLASLPDADLLAVAQVVSTQCLALALAAAPAAFARRVLRLLPGGQARQLRRALGRLSPLRISDLEAAQQHMARAARDLTARDATASPGATLVGSAR
jgi:flagellar motor switch protein FliG